VGALANLGYKVCDAERNHQGKGNVLLFPRSANTGRDGPVQCRERLGGLLRYYHQEAA
jgi:putative transposase